MSNNDSRYTNSGHSLCNLQSCWFPSTRVAHVLHQNDPKCVWYFLAVSWILFVLKSLRGIAQVAFSSWSIDLLQCAEHIVGLRKDRHHSQSES